MKTSHWTTFPLTVFILAFCFFCAMLWGAKLQREKDYPLIRYHTAYHAAPPPFKKAEAICRRKLSTASALVFFFDPPVEWQVQCWTERVYDLAGNEVWKP